MNIWPSFLFRIALESLFAFLLLAVFLYTRKRFKKSSCQTRLSYFWPLVWLLLFLGFSWFSYLPKVLDVHSLAFSQIYSEEVQVESVNLWGQVYTDRGSFLLLGQEEPQRQKRYRIRYLPWSHVITAFEEVDSSAKTLDSTQS